MTSHSLKPAIDYLVGYGQPPLHTRFQKGRSGNPGGRARGMTAERAKALVLQEAYRPVTMRVGDKVLTLPAIQAVLRSQVALAAKGHGPSQRAFIAAVQAIEREIAENNPEPDPSDMDILDAARRIAHVLHQGARIAKEREAASNDE
jgi:Family of unknown function (DUF5681)